MKSFLRLLALSLLGSLAACTATTELDIFNLPVPSSGYRLLPDVAYGALPEQKLDVYVPTSPPRAGAGVRPVVVFLHGGNWTTGDKALYRFVGEAMTSRGFVAVVANFRQYPAVKFPVFLNDAAKAVAFTHAHAADYGGDSTALFLMGHSSGAHIMAMVALDGRYLAAEGLTPAILRGAIGLSGPYDFLPFTADDVKDIFSPANADLSQTQPVTFVTPGAPAFLLLQGADDTTVLPRNSDRLATRLHAAGDIGEEHLYPDTAHVGMILDLAPLLRHRAPVLDDIAAFIAAQSAPAQQENASNGFPSLTPSH